MDTEQKLNILTDSSKYDLACSCRMKDEPGRMRGQEGRWIYPAVLPDGRKTFLLKVLQSNHCINDCKYCPFNDKQDLERCSLGSDELAAVFMKLKRANRVDGLFLSSGIACSPDMAMSQMLDTVEILRIKYRFKGFIHLKVIPGCSDQAIFQAVRLATKVSVNIEAPTADRLGRLSSRKSFHSGIISAIKKINYYKQELGKRCGQSTQFVVGAAGESDKEIITASSKLYKGFEMERVYFSAYQPLNATPEILPGTQLALFDDIPLSSKRSNDSFIREHRLYQTDFLMRKYGFELSDIPINSDGNLDLKKDPKQIWADQHMDIFPVNINQAEYYELVRVPGIGPILARRIIKYRKMARISPSNIKKLGLNLNKSQNYIKL